MKINLRRKVAVFVLLLVLLLSVFPSLSADRTVTRPSNSGKLHLEGTTLVSESGETAVLRGVSTHGLTYYPEFVNEALFGKLSYEWDCNLVRLAMYSTEYCKSGASRQQSLALMEQGISYCIANDLYVLCDWHTLGEHDPNVYLNEALEFFSCISAKYADCPNILYEICNEPNGDVTWAEVKRYAEQVIPVIKNNDPDAVIIVGTPGFSSDLSAPLYAPIQGYSNILYAYHFYAGDHEQAERQELENALQSGLPVFVTECGLVEADGDGSIRYESAQQWFELLDRYNLSFSVWNLSNKHESSAMFRNTVRNAEKITDDDLTACGQYVKALLQGTPIADIPGTITGSVTLREKWKGNTYFAYLCIATGTLTILLLIKLLMILFRKKSRPSYDELLRRTGKQQPIESRDKKLRAGKVFLVFSVFTTVIYLTWRVCFSLPRVYGHIPSVFSVLLLLIEVFGFFESCVHYAGMIRLKEYPLPDISPEEYPDVDIFVATYNEPAEILRKTLIGCKHIRYPDKSKVHIYLCDDKRRREMRVLAEELGVTYFDRPNNIGAKAGNLNAAMARTSSPYIVTFDADMIPMEDFLLKTIPYFVDAKKRNATLPESERMPLGLLQTPQCFYNPDVFQHNLYAEKRIPNEQDFFYRTIEAAKTSSNSVIYGGSNTILSRAAIEAIGGFYTGSITEDFATGLLIESHGFISLGLSEPLASGLSPATFKEHIQQRTRWGRGVILTAKKLRFLHNRNLNIPQKLSYLTSVLYWYSPLKNWFYVLSPMVFAVLGVPVLLCDLNDILLFWAPMFLFQNITLRLISGGSLSAKRSGIQETCMMPYLLLPVLQETVGISLSTFKVTDKKAGVIRRQKSLKSALPFLILILLSVVGIVRVTVQLIATKTFSLLSVLYWLTRNLYFLLMCLFLLDGRDGNGENVIVTDAEPVTVRFREWEYFGITTMLTEHSLSVFADDMTAPHLGQSVTVELNGILMSCAIVSMKESRSANVPPVYTMEILDFGEKKDEYIHLLYNRVPTLPQNLRRDIGFLRDLWINLVQHISAQCRY